MRIGEIVETGSMSFVAESDLHQPPVLGMRAPRAGTVDGAAPGLWLSRHANRH